MRGHTAGALVRHMCVSQPEGDVVGEAVIGGERGNESELRIYLRRLLNSFKEFTPWRLGEKFGERSAVRRENLSWRRRRSRRCARSPTRSCRACWGITPRLSGQTGCVRIDGGTASFRPSDESTATALVNVSGATVMDETLDPDALDAGITALRQVQ